MIGFTRYSVRLSPFDLSILTSISDVVVLGTARKKFNFRKLNFRHKLLTSNHQASTFNHSDFSIKSHQFTFIFPPRT